MLPIDPRGRIPFTPPHLWNEERDSEKPKPVMWLKPLSIIERARLNSTIASYGARVISESEMNATRRDLLAQMELPEEEIAAVLALYEMAASLRSEGKRLEVEDQVALEKVNRALIQNSEHYRMLNESTEFYYQIAPALALQQQCLGWSDLPGKNGQPAVFKRVSGKLTEESMQSLDTLTLTLAGFRVISLGNVSESDAKKSEPPSSSPDAPAG